MRSAEDSKIYLVTGEDPDLVYKSLTELVEAIAARDGADFERITFQGGECSVQDVVNSLSQNFIFAPKALVVLRDTSTLSTEDASVLATTLEQYDGENILILENHSGTLDSKLKSVASTRGCVIAPLLKSKNDKSTFLSEFVRESGLRFDPEAFRLLSQTLGEDVSKVVPLIDVLRAAVGENGRVDIEVLRSYLPAPGDIAPWDFTDAIEAGKVDEALELLTRLMQAGRRHPLVVIAILQRRLVELSLVSGAGIRTAAQALEALRERDRKYSRPEFVLRNMISISRNIGYSRLVQAFQWMSLADRQIKGEGGLSPELAVELLVARLAKSFSNR